MEQLPKTRHTLIARLRDPEDQAAWNEFTGIYEPIIYRLARRYGLQHVDAQDIVQDVLATISKTVSDWKPGPEHGRFRGWLYRTTRNLTINALTRGPFVSATGDAAIQGLLEEQPAGDPLETRFDLEWRREVFLRAAEAVRKEVQPLTWQAFWRTSVEQADIPETAGDLGMSVGAVYAARSRILARLRTKVEELDLGKNC